MKSTAWVAARAAAVAPCHAVIHHGPGHQSTTRCERIGVHRVHCNTALGRLFEWVGDDACTDYWDECPDIDE